MSTFEENREISLPLSWILVLAMCALILAWGILQYFFVRDPPSRQWDFGSLPETPAESIYSSRPSPPAAANVPRQIPSLPEARGAGPGGRP